MEGAACPDTSQSVFLKAENKGVSQSFTQDQTRLLVRIFEDWLHRVREKAALTALRSARFLADNHKSLEGQIMGDSDIKLKKLASLVDGEDIDEGEEEEEDESEEQRELRKNVDILLRQTARLAGENLFDMQYLLEACCADIREQIEGLFEEEDNEH
jgi:hypothetical protein